MKYLISYIFFFLISLNSLISQEATSPAKATKSKNIANALLWGISGNGLTDTSYLYGTIHLIDKEDFFLTEKTKVAFAASEKVTFEINMEDMMDMGTQMSLMMKAFMNDGKTLKDLLDEEDYKTVQTHFEKMGMNSFVWNMMERIKPMFLSIFASTDITGGGLASGEMMSYEMEFMTMAKDQSKTMSGLETAEYQMSMFDSIPYEVQAQMLVESIKAENTNSDQLEEMVKLYKKQDLKGMQKMFEADEEGIGKYENLLLIGRNKNWIPVMQKMMAEQVTFFAVGAGHLGGEFGVVNLLKEAGYTMTPFNKRTL